MLWSFCTFNIMCIVLIEKIAIKVSKSPSISWNCYESVCISHTKWSATIGCIFLNRYHPIQAAMKMKHIPPERLKPQLSRNPLNKSFGYSFIAAISNFMKRLELAHCWCHKQQLPALCGNYHYLLKGCNDHEGVRLLGGNNSFHFHMQWG